MKIAGWSHASAQAAAAGACSSGLRLQLRLCSQGGWMRSTRAAAAEPCRAMQQRPGGCSCGCVPGGLHALGAAAACTLWPRWMRLARAAAAAACSSSPAAAAAAVLIEAACRWQGQQLLLFAHEQLQQWVSGCSCSSSCLRCLQQQLHQHVGGCSNCCLT
jgi:hypothetical protein